MWPRFGTVDGEILDQLIEAGADLRPRLRLAALDEMPWRNCSMTLPTNAEYRTHSGN